MLNFLRKSFKKIASSAGDKALESRVECNICHHTTDLFASDDWHLYTICQQCGSQIRQRLLWATLEHLKGFNFKKILKDKDVLHFSPERILGDLIRSYARNYKTADFLTEGYSYDKIDLVIDISHMPSIQDESFDCVIACDVLEHVPNHLDAMKEIHRILRKDGYCILTVPQKDNLKVTYEDPSITEPSERERVFGQFDHLRIYGEDFSTFLEQSGFKVTAVNESFFPKELVKKYVLFPPVLSRRENATNFRNVFIGKK
jgi:SAM-dependent methyltransferase